MAWLWENSQLEMWYLHAPDRTTPYEVTLKAVNNLYKEGKFKRFGISNYMACVYSVCSYCTFGWDSLSSQLGGCRNCRYMQSERIYPANCLSRNLQCDSQVSRNASNYLLTHFPLIIGTLNLNSSPASESLASVSTNLILVSTIGTNKLRHWYHIIRSVWRLLQWPL